MILLQNLFDLLEFCAENNTYIQHTPGATGSQNRFSRFPIESATDQQSNLGFPRMEVVQLPFGIINDYDSAQRDDMSVRLRVIIKLSDKYDYAEQVTAMDNAKRALMEMVNYILTAQEGYTNENCLICAFDINSAKYQFIDRLTYGGNAVGCELSIDFKQYIDWDNIVYGDLPGYPTFCDQVEECLSIPTANGQYVLTITNNVISWEEFSASGLVDGNGTTINGNKVDLGGDVIQDTILQFNPREYSLRIGDTANSSELYFGDVQNDGVFLFGANDYDFASFNGGGFEVTSSSVIRFNVDNNSGFAGGVTVDPYTTSNGPASGIYLKEDQVDEYGFFAINDGIKKYANIYYGVLDANNVITDTSRWEANENEVHGRKYITVGGNYNGVHCNTSYSQLEYNKVTEDGQDTGTLLTLNEDGVNHYQNGAILNQFDNSGFMYIGSESVDGSWRFATSSGNLVIQKRESGSWVTKQTLV